MKLDESQPEHVDSLLKTIASHERESGKPIDAQVVTWRGIMTKVGAQPKLLYSTRELILT